MFQKLSKYKDFGLEIRRMQHHNTTILFVGAFGLISKEVTKYVDQIPDNIKISKLYKTIFRGISHILHKMHSLQIQSYSFSFNINFIKRHFYFYSIKFVPVYLSSFLSFCSSQMMTRPTLLCCRSPFQCEIFSIDGCIEMVKQDIKVYVRNNPERLVLTAKRRGEINCRD